MSWQPKKRKHQKVDLANHKVQYIVDVQLKSNQAFPNINKNPELIKVNINDQPQLFKSSNSPYLIGGKMFGWQNIASKNKNKALQ